MYVPVPDAKADGEAQRELPEVGVEEDRKMSKLKEVYAYQSDEIESLVGNAIGDSYYLKSEADKVIAELKESIKDLILDNYLKDKEIRRQKYKRCLANAEACMHKRWRTDDGFDYARSQRHMSKWLTIAEKFKPHNSTAQ